MNRFRHLARSPDSGTSGERIEGGIAGRATIEAVVDTGETLEDNPEVELEMTVDLPGRAPYRVGYRKVVSRLVLHQLEPGSAVPVVVDPRDPSHVEIG